jgi:hypothetical protein
VAKLPARRNIGRQDAHDLDPCGRKVGSRNGLGRLMVVIKPDHKPDIDDGSPVVLIHPNA